MHTSSSKIAEEFGDILPSLHTSTRRNRDPSGSAQASIFRKMLREACIDTYVLQFDNDDFEYSSFEAQLDTISKTYQNAYPKRSVKSVIFKKEHIVTGRRYAVLEIRLNTVEKLEISLQRKYDIDAEADDVIGGDDDDAGSQSPYDSE
jgi:hypothetical protein